MNSLSTTSRTSSLISIVTRTKGFDYTHNGVKGQIQEDICNGVSVPDKCEGHTDALVLFVPDEGNECVTFVSPDFENTEYSLLDKEKPLDGLKMRNDKVGFEIDIKCNSEIATPSYNLDGSTLTIQSKDSCGDINEAARVFSEHKYILCLIGMVIGLVLMLFGGYKWDLLLGFVGFIVGFAFIFFVFWSFVDYKKETSSYIIIAVIALMVGILLAYLCKQFVILSYLLIGFATGFFLSKYLLTIFHFNGEKVS